MRFRSRLRGSWWLTVWCSLRLAISDLLPQLEHLILSLTKLAHMAFQLFQQFALRERRIQEPCSPSRVHWRPPKRGPICATEAARPSMTADWCSIFFSRLFIKPCPSLCSWLPCPLSRPTSSQMLVVLTLVICSTFSACCVQRSTAVFTAEIASKSGGPQTWQVALASALPSPW